MKTPKQPLLTDRGERLCKIKCHEGRRVRRIILGHDTGDPCKYIKINHIVEKVPMTDEAVLSSRSYRLDDRLQLPIQDRADHLIRRVLQPQGPCVTS
eukprot:9503769-Pyramimonas_sp.AAC.1